jgi:hypothetical protein
MRKMYFGLMLTSISIVLLLVGLSGCDEKTTINDENDIISDRENLIGKWERDDGGVYYTFFLGGSFKFELEKSTQYMGGTYELSEHNNSLELVFTINPDEQIQYEYEFIDRDTLKLTLKAKEEIYHRI